MCCESSLRRRVSQVTCHFALQSTIVSLKTMPVFHRNKIMLVYHPGLLDAIIDIANHDPIEEAREHAAIVLMNLVSTV